MAIPASYTESDLALFMASALGSVATALVFSAPDSYQEAINETLLAYGVTDIAQATDIRKLRALARREAWRLAASSAAARYTIIADGTTLTRSQLHQQISANLALAETDALPYDSGYCMQRSAIRHSDAYTNTPDGET